MELKRSVFEGVRQTVNKFREQPSIFFSELDLRAYLYHCLYRKKLEVTTKDGVVTTCVHQDYPTNFRYSKETLDDHGLEKKGKRGTFDLAILNPVFVTEYDLKDIENRDIRHLERRSRTSEEFRNELIALIEIKYVTHNKSSFIDEIKKDLRKLSIARTYQDFLAFGLVFCNHKFYFMDELKKLVETADPSIRSLLAVSYFPDSGKTTPTLLTNGWNLYES